jgi:hypothetical protein
MSEKIFALLFLILRNQFESVLRLSCNFLNKNKVLTELVAGDLTDASIATPLPLTDCSKLYELQAIFRKYKKK